MKKKILLTLCASLLSLGLASCGEDNSSSDPAGSEPTSTPTSTGNAAFDKITGLLAASNALDDSKIVSASLSVMGNEWRTVESEDALTGKKTSTHKITRYEGQKNDLTFYSDQKAKVETQDIISNTNGTETVTKVQHLYGEAHGLLIDLASDYRDDAYEVNLLKSGSSSIATSNPKDDEIIREDANKVLNKGLIEKKSYGATSYLLGKYFEGDKFFGTNEAKDNATLETNGNKYTLSSTFASKDDVENPLVEEYKFNFEFDNGGYLIALDGSLATYAATMSSEQALDRTPTTEKGLKSYEWVIDFKQTLGTRTASGVDLEQYFFTDKNEINISFRAGPNWGEDIDLTTNGEKNKEYVIKVGVASGSGVPNIDKVHLYKVERNGSVASKDSYEIGKNDSNEETIKLKKGGEYILHFKSALVEDITKEATIVTNDLTSLAFKERDDAKYGPSKDEEYLPEHILAGETQFTLITKPTNATDDVTVEILNNDIGATISKVEGSSFTYKLVTAKTGTITVKAVSASLGEENAVTKEVKVYANTDEGIASFLSETNWVIQNAGATLKNLTFTSSTSTSGMISYTSSLKDGFTATGTFSVNGGQVILETTSWDPSSVKGTCSLQYVKVTPGRGDIDVKTNPGIAYFMQN